MQFTDLCVALRSFRNLYEAQYQLRRKYNYPGCDCVIRNVVVPFELDGQRFAIVLEASPRPEIELGSNPTETQPVGVIVGWIRLSDLPTATIYVTDTLPTLSMWILMQLAGCLQFVETIHVRYNPPLAAPFIPVKPGLYHIPVPLPTREQLRASAEINWE